LLVWSSSPLASLRFQDWFYSNYLSGLGVFDIRSPHESPTTRTAGGFDFTAKGVKK
jgi:hypothetical protein